MPSAAQTAWRCLLGLTVACAAVASVNAEKYTKVKPYAVAVSPDCVLQPLLSAGNQAPNTSDPSKSYQMVGIPDGLGATKGPGNTTILFMNHELSNGSVSEPNVGGPLNRGAFVSRFILDKNACVVSGKRAYDTVHDEETGFVYPAAEKWAIPLRDSAASARDRSPSGKPASTAQSTSPMGAFGFIRIEDGAWSKTDKNKFYFVTTGSGTGNQLGNAYEVTFDKNNILATTKITQIYNGDAVAAAGGDIGFAPDNIDTSKDYLMV